MGACEFCDEIESGKFPHGNGTLDTRILFETEHFIVVPSLGSFVEGYLLTLPKKHYYSMAQLPSQWYPELEYVQHCVQQILKIHYLSHANCASPLFFEHGAVSPSKRAGCCIDHAHIHAVPVPFDISSILQELGEPKHFPDHPHKPLTSFSELPELSSGEPYLFIQTNDGKRMLFSVSTDLPSQYFRRKIAENIGKSDAWDWAVFPHMDTLKNTLDTLRYAEL